MSILDGGSQSGAILMVERCKLDCMSLGEGPRRRKGNLSEVSPTWHHFGEKHEWFKPRHEAPRRAHVLENCFGR